MSEDISDAVFTDLTPEQVQEKISARQANGKSVSKKETDNNLDEKETSWLLSEETVKEVNKLQPYERDYVRDLNDAAVSEDDPGSKEFWENSTRDLQNRSYDKKDIFPEELGKKLVDRITNHVENMDDTTDSVVKSQTMTAENNPKEPLPGDDDWIYPSTPVSSSENNPGTPTPEDDYMPLKTPDGSLDPLSTKPDSSAQEVEFVTRLKGIEADDPERQRERVRILLDEIERKTSFFNPEGLQEQELINSEKKLKPEVWQEVRARLHLHAVTVGLNWVFLSEKDVNPIDKLRNMVGRLTGSEDKSGQKRSWLIDGQDLNVFFKEGLEGIKVAKAYNLLQISACESVRDDSGKIIKRPEKSEAQIQAEEADLLVKLDGDEKSLELARRLRFVLFEQSAEEWKITDPVSQVFFFEDTRKILDAGPSFTSAKIHGLGTSFLRRQETVNKRKLFNNDKYQKIITELDSAKSWAQQIKAIENLDRLNRLEAGFWARQGRDVQNRDEYILPVSDRKVDYMDIPVGAYAKYLAGYLPGILNAKKLLLQSDWKPEDMMGDKIDPWFAIFDNSDGKEQRLGHRVFFVAGALHSVFGDRNRASNLQWGQQKWRTVRRLLVQPRAAAKGKSFLTEDQMSHIENELGLRPARKLVGVNPEKF